MRSVVGAVLLMYSCLGFANPWHLVTDQPLRDGPSGGAGVVGRISASTVVEVLEKQRGFARIKSGREAGWVSVFALRQGDRQRTGVLREANDLLRYGMREAESTRIVAVTGLRGVMDDALKANEPDVRELIYLEALAESGAKVPADKAGPRLSWVPHLRKSASGWSGHENE